MTQPTGQYDPDPEDYPDSRDRSGGWIWAIVVIALVAVGAVLWVSLGSDEPDAEPSASPTPSPPTSTSSETTATTSAPTSPTSPSETGASGDFSTDPVTGGGFPEPGDSIGYGTAVRVGSQEGYDRVVFEFSGSGEPSYQVQYTDSPVAQGSGDPVQVAGDAYLEVSITTVDVPSGTSTPTMTTPDTAGTVFAQVEGIWGGFEGYGQTFVGIDGGERPFHVEVLQDPMRLVVDVDNG
jgi:hypothetical protein